MKHRINIFIYVLLITLTALFLSEATYFIPLLILETVLFFVVLTLGVLFLRFNYFLPSITHYTNTECLLTFDDGPDPIYTPKILDILQRNKVKAIFFVIGEKAEQNPELVERIIQEGHLVGNHSYSHHKLIALFPTTTLIEDLEKCQVILKQITGEENKLFRAPIGYTNPNFARALKALKLHSIGWNLRSYDTLSKSKEALIHRLVQQTKKGSIVLLHDNLPQTYEALEEYIVQARRNGLLFASGDLKNNLKYD